MQIIKEIQLNNIDDIKHPHRFQCWDGIKFNDAGFDIDDVPYRNDIDSEHEMTTVDVIAWARDYNFLGYKAYSKGDVVFIGPEKNVPSGFTLHVYDKPAWETELRLICDALNIGDPMIEELNVLYARHCMFDQWNDSRGIKAGTDMLRIIREHVTAVGASS